MIVPTQDEIREFMEAYNGDEVGIDNLIDMEEAEYLLLNSDEFYYKNLNDKNV
jgi:hypothetical protein